jgi:autotransporter-associated beta strand protein
MFSNLWSLRSRKPLSSGGRARGAARRKPTRQLRLEALENRLTPTTHFWIGPASGDVWSNPSNWANGVPTTGESGGTVVRFNTGTNSTDDINGLIVDQILFDGGNNLVQGTTPLGISHATLTTNIQSVSGQNTLAGNLLLVVQGSFLGVTVNAGALVIAGNISGNGGLIMQGDATLALTGTNSYTGETDVVAGTLLLNSSSPNGAIPSTLAIENGTVQELSSNNIADTADVLTGGLLDLNGFNEEVGSIDDNGTITNSNMTTQSTLTVHRSGASGFFNGLLSGNLALIKVGPDTLALVNFQGPNTYTGPTDVQGGVLDVANGNLGSTASGTFVEAGATLEFGSQYTVAEPVTLAAGATVVGHAFPSDAGFAGPISLLGDSGLVSLADPFTLTGNITPAAGNVTLTANSVTNGGDPHDLIISGRLSGALSLTKIGDATLTLTGNNSYSGSTTVNAGTLLVNGPQPISPVTVNTGATLGGTGVTGPVVANRGGTVAPGVNGPGTLATPAGVTFLSGSTFAVDLNGTTAGTQYDVLRAGLVDLGGTTLAASLGAGFQPSVGDTFTIVRGTSSVTGTFAQGSSFVLGGQTFQITYNPNSVVLTVVNTGPTVDPPTVTPASIREGGGVTVSGTFSDPNQGETHTVLIAWGDGTTDTVNLGVGVTAYGPVPHTYNDNRPGGAPYTITVTVTDSNGGSGSNTATASVANVAPTTTLGNSGPVSEGGTAAVSVTGQTDPSSVDTAAGFRYAYDFDNDGTFDVGDGTYAGSVATATTTVPARFLVDGPATRTVRARILDKDDGSTDLTTVLTITNVAPANVAVAATPDTVVENSTVTLNGSFTDPGTLDTHMVVINWGDGSANTTLSLAAGTLTFGTTHAYLDNAPGNAPIPISVTVTDKDGASAPAASARVTVTNVAPVPAIAGLPLANLGNEATPLTLTASAQDPSPVDTAAGFAFAWNVTRDGLPFTTAAGASLTLTPGGSGAYEIVLSATDKDGGQTTARATLTVVPGGVSFGFVFGLYRDVLGRVPDGPGFRSWMSQLHTGSMSRSQVARLFLNSSERQAMIVEQFYRQILGRASDAAGKAFWEQRLAGGASEADVETAFATSPEFLHHHAGNAAFVNALYTSLLGRPASAAEAALQTGVLDSGQQTHSQMASAFVTSDEAYHRTIRDAYGTYLGRPPDATGESVFFNALHSSQADRVALAAAILASEEYFLHLGNGF